MVLTLTNVKDEKAFQISMVVFAVTKGILKWQNITKRSFTHMVFPLYLKNSDLQSSFKVAVDEFNIGGFFVTIDNAQGDFEMPYMTALNFQK